MGIRLALGAIVKGAIRSAAGLGIKLAAAGVVSGIVLGPVRDTSSQEPDMGRSTY
jgi:hypothetical protein